MSARTVRQWCNRHSCHHWFEDECSETCPILEHSMVVVEGEIEVCRVCVNSYGNPVAWPCEHADEAGYTPTTDEIRDGWYALVLEGLVGSAARDDANWDGDRALAQFDRWFALVRGNNSGEDRKFRGKRKY